ncbi:Protease Do-like 7 [Zea mays]|uniref:Protease Do-like 7 n=1 Tax=Zea mays TaxID=4577 RepID=A0A1D6LBF8_MAIZE|nr:Protease Do-like 7 [Zea mays]
MDISRVGEKLLSSVRSLGLLPPTPVAPPSRPEVPERAAAAAAAARAIAGLPPHERINLPSNSEDLVSIYGSNPQGQAVEELEEVFYEEEFDPIKYILQSIPDEGSDATYFDEQDSMPYNLYAFDTEVAGASYATGFVVDKSRGIILTNRHVVKPGPVVAEAMFVNREEIPVYPLYRDPVHDFGFFRYDPGAIKFLKYDEIQLAPEAASVGLEIWVVGNDSGENVPRIIS